MRVNILKKIRMKNIYSKTKLMLDILAEDINSNILYEADRKHWIIHLENLKKAGDYLGLKDDYDYFLKKFKEYECKIKQQNKK